MHHLNVAIFGSKGSTAEFFFDAKIRGDPRLQGVTPTVAITDMPHAGILGVAERAGVPSVLIARKDFATGTPEFGEVVRRVCEMHKVNFLALLGFLGHIPENVLAQFPHGVNLHPGALDPGRPDFGGKGMYGERATLANFIFARVVNGTRPPHLACAVEATVQAIHSEVDRGEIYRRKCFFPRKKAPLETGPALDKALAGMVEKVRRAERSMLLEVLSKFAKKGSHPSTFTRTEPIVRPGEEPIITFARWAAILHFMKTN
jgi:folate-dependent phosphoribosylglycinamide formyltransferase PurN